jgi:hypothetical protein
VELHRAAHRPAGLERGRLVGLVEKQQVRRRQAGRACQLLDALQQEQAMFVRARQQARPRDRREGDGAEQLRVVLETVPAIRVGPGPIEDVFAVGMVLKIERACGDQGSVAFEQDEVRRPSGLGDCAARIVQGTQVCERNERRGGGLCREERRPRFGVDLAGVGADAQGPGIRFGGAALVFVVHPNGSSQRRILGPSRRACGLRRPADEPSRCVNRP